MLRLTKHHGLGNDFLVALDALNPELVPDPEVARAVCDRRTGIGADGLIYALAPAEPGNDACMVLLNSDGSEAEISGNGIRCLVQADARARSLDRGETVVDTPAGRRVLVFEATEDPLVKAILESFPGATLSVRQLEELIPDTAYEDAFNDEREDE